MPTHSASGENPLPRLQRAAFSLGPHMAFPWCPWREGERRSSLASLLGRTTVQSLTTSIPPHGLGPPHVNFREIQTFNSGHSPSSVSPPNLPKNQSPTDTQHERSLHGLVVQPHIQSIRLCAHINRWPSLGLHTTNDRKLTIYFN